jgi:hypothetical protein
VKAASGSALSLPAGTYNLSARTADGFMRTATLELTAGQTRNLDLALAPEGMSKWADPAGWKQEQGAFVRIALPGSLNRFGRLYGRYVTGDRQPLKWDLPAQQKRP